MASGGGIVNSIATDKIVATADLHLDPLYTLYAKDTIPATDTQGVITNHMISSIVGTAPGRRLGITSNLSGSGNFTTSAMTTHLRITLIGGGGSGGGTPDTSGSKQASGAGGGAGALLIAYIAVNPSTAYAYVVGAGGAGAAGSGNDGADTTIIVGATTYTAGGGKKGSSTAAAATTVWGIAFGGLGGVATNGDVNGVGATGDSTHYIYYVTYNTVYSGRGADTLYGPGGQMVSFNTSGANATGYGAGGSGATFSNGAAQVGGNGGGGLIIIEEWS